MTLFIMDNLRRGLHLHFPQGKFLVTKFEFEGSFGMSLEGDYFEVKVTSTF
jgi:hypothetical protein